MRFSSSSNRIWNASVSAGTVTSFIPLLSAYIGYSGKYGAITITSLSFTAIAFRDAITAAAAPQVSSRLFELIFMPYRSFRSSAMASLARLSPPAGV